MQAKRLSFKGLGLRMALGMPFAIKLGMSKEAESQYSLILQGIADVIEESRHSTVRAVNALMTATYWLIGGYIVESEQEGSLRAEYGGQLLKRLAADLSQRFGRGYSVDNLESMRAFYLIYPPNRISETVSRKSLGTIGRKSETVSRKSSDTIERRKSETVSRILPGSSVGLTDIASAFPLSWSHYVLLVRRSRSEEARAFYEAEALRGGWSVRQLSRQMSSQFYERTALSKDKVAMLRKGQVPVPSDIVSAQEAIKNPFVLEFLDLKDEYSESDFEDALIQHLQTFLLELGGDFCFIGRQKRLRVGDTWYRVDLIFFHRCLRCLVIVDLKIGAFSHADAGQMHLYLNYAKEHWTHEGENPPVGLILCAQKDAAIARYALEGLPNEVIAAEYRMTLPDEKKLAAEIEKTRAAFEERIETSKG